MFENRCPAFTYTVPIGLIQATTNVQVALNVITELIIGYALPGRPIAMMLFKTWGYWTMRQALEFTSDFKLGHYMKIPHRPMFWCQIVATIVAGTVQVSVQAWMFSNVEDLCSPDQRDSFSCPATTVFGTASIIVSCHSLAIFLFALFKAVVIVGRHRTTAYFLARSALPRSRLLPRIWRLCAVYSVGNAQEVQDELPQIPQLPSHLFGYG
jgi:OPT family oligopeptide transporter